MARSKQHFNKTIMSLFLHYSLKLSRKLETRAYTLKLDWNFIKLMMCWKHAVNKNKNTLFGNAKEWALQNRLKIRYFFRMSCQTLMSMYEKGVTIWKDPFRNRKSQSYISTSSAFHHLTKLDKAIPPCTRWRDTPVAKWPIRIKVIAILEDCSYLKMHWQKIKVWVYLQSKGK